MTQEDKIISNYYRYVQEQVLVDKIYLTWYTDEKFCDLFLITNKELSEVKNKMEFLPKKIIKKMPF